jgi:hypothetical protein
MPDYIDLEPFFDTLKGMKKSEVQQMLNKNYADTRDAKITLWFITMGMTISLWMAHSGEFPSILTSMAAMACGVGYYFNIRGLAGLKKERNKLLVHEVMES